MSSSHARIVRLAIYESIHPPSQITVWSHATSHVRAQRVPVFTSRRVRGWKRLDRDRFRGALSAGPLCQDEDYYDGMSASELFDVYTSTIRETLDRLVPLHDIVSRFRPSTPWFDAECRSVKRGARLLERRYRRTRNPEDRLAWIHALREKHSFFMSKENSYWENTVKSNSSNPKKLWRSVSTILGEPAKQTATHSTFSAAEFLTFLEQKVETIRSDTAGSAPPIFTPTDCSFSSFTPCTQQFVRNLIGSAPSKSCELDPAPTFLIKEFLDTLLPFLTRLCNVSLQEGRLPSSQTTAIVTPALKKHGLDPTDMKNFRPISNLSFMSKIVERIVVRQLSQYLDANGLLPKLQSGFRRHHSTESALLRVLSDLFSSVDSGRISLLALLDVSAAFDTVDHAILLDRLSISFGITGSAFDWMRSFIVGRTQTVHYCGSISQCAVVRSGVAQGSVLGPLLYVLYTADIQKLVESLGFGVHLYADDTQFHGSCAVSEAAGLASRAVRVVNEIKNWMSSNRLRLNADKTQFIWLGTGHFLGNRDTQAINTILSSTDIVNNLGVYLDSELTLERQVSKLCQVCYFHLRRLRTVRRSLSKECLRTLVHAFVTSRVDHCNSLLYGSYSYLLDRLQSVLNSAARLVLNIAKFSGISAAIRDELHWLPIRKRIEFKIVLLVRHCLVGAAPEYLIELCRPVSSAAGRQSLRSASRGDLIIPRFRLRTFGSRAFAISGPQLWNSLPLDVRQSRDNLLQFKMKLKTFLFQQFWALLWILSNEGPYKCSILLLLLLNPNPNPNPDPNPNGMFEIWQFLRHPF